MRLYNAQPRWDQLGHLLFRCNTGLQMICDEQMLAVKSEVAKCLGRNQSSSMESVVAQVCMNLYQKRLYIQFSDETVITVLRVDVVWE